MSSDGTDWSFPPVEPAGPADGAAPPTRPPAQAGPASEPADAVERVETAEPAQGRPDGSQPMVDAAARLGFGGPHVRAWSDEPTAAYTQLPEDLGPAPELGPAAAPASAPVPTAAPASAPVPTAAPASTPVPTAAPVPVAAPTSAPVPTAAPVPVAPAADPAWAYGAPLPPVPNLDIPRRNPATGTPVSPLRALAGAMVAVAGVLLGIGALLWATDAPVGDPTVRTAQNVQVSAAPSTVASVAAPPAASVAPSPRPIAAQSSPAAVVRPEPAAPPKLPLTVLNNSNRTLLADRAAREFRAAGWPIRLTGNFTGRVSETTVYYEPGQLASARLLQRAFPGLIRVRPRFDTLPGEGLTVVLTRSYDA